MERENLQIILQLQDKIKAKVEKLNPSLQAHYRIKLLYRILASIKRESKDAHALEESCIEFERVLEAIQTDLPVKSRTLRNYRNTLKSFLKTYTKRYNLKVKWQYSRFWQFWGWGAVVLSMSMLLTMLEIHIDQVFIVISSLVLANLIGFITDKYFERKGKVI